MFILASAGFTRIGLLSLLGDLMGELLDTGPKGQPDQIDLADSVPSRFARLAAVHSFRTAVGSGAWQPTYQELNETANRVANALLKHGGAARGRIALLMRHDAPLIAAMIAVLKAAGVVVVLNPTDPLERLKQLVEDAEAGLILADLGNQDLAADIAARTCTFVRFEDHATEGLAHNPEIRTGPTDTALLVYTSGSAGRHKAVMLTHQQLLHIGFRSCPAMDLVSEDRIALLSSLSGGAGMYLAWGALLSGASVCPFPTMEKGVTGLARWMREGGITVYSSVVSLFRQFVRTLNDGTCFPFMRVMRISGERATSEDFHAYQMHFSEGCTFVHTLGSSEAGTIATLRLSRHDTVNEGYLPAGRAMEGVEILLLDENGRHVGDGETGEIFVRGHYLSAGYWRDASLTAVRFSTVPEGGGLRIFRTGDLGRFNSDRLLEFVGRVDDQVKIRGYRIEVSEVELALHAVPVIERAVVGALDRPNNEPQLVAWVVLRNGRPSSAATLRRALRAVLPGYMIPSAFVFLESFPLTPHGKIDREQLRQNHALNRDLGSSEPPVTATESLLASVWAEVFNLPQIYRHDDFFDLGGDSLIASRIAVKIHAKIGIELNLGLFAHNPTVAGLAGVIDSLRAHDTSAALRIVRCSRHNAPNGLPLSFIQERAWKDSQTAKGAAGYIFTSSYRILGPLDRQMLQECMTYVAARHEPLRTTFSVVDGQPVQIIHPPASVPLPFLDLVGMPGPEQRAIRELEKEAGRTFDLAKGPLLRFLLIRTAENEHWLLRTFHHIILDASSSALFFRELGLLYEAKVRGEVPPLPEFELLQYGDYAVWERKLLRRDGSAYKDSVAWWKATLAGAPSMLTLPFRRTRALTDIDPAEGLLKWGLEPEISLRLAKLTREEGTTYYIVRLAIFAILLCSETGESDVVLGTYVANRNRAELQSMFGLFTNLATLRLRCETSSTFRDWLYAVRKRTLETVAHCQIPYEELRHELVKEGASPPNIQVIFNVDRHHMSFHFADLELIRQETRTGGMPWGLSVTLDEHQEDHNCHIMFDAGLYRPSGVHRLIDRYRRLLGAVSRDPDLSINELIARSVQDHHGRQ
jgi:amino acid adenylation domain-containing protein